MTDQQREKYAIARDKLFDEQCAELEFVVDIMNRAKKTRQKTINGVCSKALYEKGLILRNCIQISKFINRKGFTNAPRYGIMQMKERLKEVFLMLTAVGKFLRKLRIDRGEILRDMATKLGVSSAFLSSVENGRKKMPDAWPEKLVDLYDLSPEQANELTDAAIASNDIIELHIADASDEQKRLAVSFARQFESLDTELSMKIFRMLNGNTEE